MTATGDQPGRPRPARPRLLRSLAAGLALLVLLGVVLIWGPVGLGNGPLGVQMGVTQVCLGAWPAHPASYTAVADRCSQARGPLIGRAVGYVRGISAGFPAAAEIAAPPARSCWVATKVVVHYHVGIRHYAASGPFAMAVCGEDAPAKLSNAAENAAEAAAF
jgi:hypothetical protein